MTWGCFLSWSLPGIMLLSIADLFLYTLQAYQSGIDLLKDDSEVLFCFHLTRVMWQICWREGMQPSDAADSVCGVQERPGRTPLLRCSMI